MFTDRHVSTYAITDDDTTVTLNVEFTVSMLLKVSPLEVEALQEKHPLGVFPSNDGKTTYEVADEDGFAQNYYASLDEALKAIKAGDLDPVEL